jgi:lysophospholipase L1-like esterase
MVGDSITHFWGGMPYANRASGQLAWSRLFAGIPVLNLGFGWDRTQNVLWRLQAGELDGLHPRWIVLNIGTNNLTGTDNARVNTPDEVLAGVDAVRQELLARSPASRLVIMAIFPRGAQPNDPLRQAITTTDRLLAAKFAHDPSVTYLDIGSSFLAPDGTLPVAMMPDGTHPSEAGYEIWADALRQVGIGR